MVDMSEFIRRDRLIHGFLFLGLAAACYACSEPVLDERSGTSDGMIVPQPSAEGSVVPISDAPKPEFTQLAPPTNPAIEIMGTPTQDPVRDPPPMREETAIYQVQPGDSLNVIAYRYQVSPIQIMEANGILDGDLLAVGQTLTIPAPKLREPGPSFKMIPNSELVYGPASIYFDIEGFVEGTTGYLRDYLEIVDDEELSGAQIIAKVAERYSVNPMLLIAILEHQSSWLYRKDISTQSAYYPIGYITSGREGLYAQLAWTADQLNTGYYRWRAGWAGPYTLVDGKMLNPGAGVNAGTVGLQYLFSQLFQEDEWRRVVDVGGFEQILSILFENPFARQVEPLLPDGLTQPELQLPFEPDSVWSFTGGPHSAWGGGTAWAALDFGPPGNAFGCVLSDEWVVASAPGIVVRAGNGEVVLDLDGDGYEQSGWVLFYMHVESRDRVSPGSYLNAGDRIGHPSCEGGLTTGTHVHIARKYNGEWISADDSIPFILDGWISVGLGEQYDGLLVRDSVQLEACACRNDTNQISR